MTFHSQSSQHPFVICQQQVQNGDFTKTARWGLKMSPQIC
jgi:hypothetical protein